MTTAPQPKAKHLKGWRLANFIRFRKDSLGFLRAAERECGPVAVIDFGFRTIVLISDPDLIQQLLVKQHRQFEKGRALKIARRLLGNGLLTSEGEEHTRNRRLIQPAFHMQRIAGYGDSMVQFADATQQSWKDGETLDIAEEMMTLTLRIVGKTLFNADTTELSERVGHAMSLLMYWFPIQMLPYGVMLERLPLPAMRRLHAAREDLNNIVLNIIAERRASARDEGDLLSMLLAAQEEDGAGLDNEQVRDEALTLFVAGHETTANALAWTWYLLAQHPDIAARLRTEIDTVLGDATPTYADVRRLPFTESVITESLRLYPPAWTIVRTPVENVELAGLPGYTLPHGSTVMACSWVMHRLERYFPDPESFRPDRWTPEFRAGLPKFAYFPFGGGPRSCIGESFAWMELILIVAVIARRWDMTLLANHQETVRLQPAVTLRPRNGINVTLRRREV